MFERTTLTKLPQIQPSSLQHFSLTQGYVGVTDNSLNTFKISEAAKYVLQVNWLCSLAVSSSAAVCVYLYTYTNSESSLRFTQIDEKFIQKDENLAVPPIYLKTAAAH